MPTSHPPISPRPSKTLSKHSRSHPKHVVYPPKSVANWSVSNHILNPISNLKYLIINHLSQIYQSPFKGKTFFLLPTLFLLSLLTLQSSAQPDTRPFLITLQDDQTNRGVPLVELTTVNNLRYVSDSAGNIAFNEPGLLNQRVFFNISSHGYEFPKDGFGIRGKALDIKPGGQAIIKIKRLNIAQRLYRITGQGIYRDTILVGKPAPLKEPLLNGQVLGQDSAHAVIFHNQIHYFWGDTNRPSYPLGHFGTAGAVADLPTSGGLDPNIGIDLTYFTDDKGFSRPTLERKGSNPRWVDGVVAFKDANGKEHLIARCDTMKSLGQKLEREIVEWNDTTKMLAPLAKLDLNEPLSPTGHPFPQTIDNTIYLYFGEPYPNLRAPAEIEKLKTPAAYEGFTCLAPTTRFDKANTKLDRDAEGKLIWSWKKNTPPISQDQQTQLIKSNLMKQSEAWYTLKDADTRQDVLLHAGSTAWNAYRKKWVLIAVQHYGKPSFLGEVWYTESDQPQGPYVYAKRIVTHDRYSFYNPVHHPFFDQEDGKTVYFEGTYTTTFSRNDNPTPRYDYNQIMYKLDLSDDRLKLPQ